MKQFILMSFLCFACAHANSQYLNDLIFEPSNQDSTFTLIGFDKVFTEYNVLEMSSSWPVGTISIDQSDKNGYKIMPVQSKSEDGSLVLACVIIHSSLVKMDDLQLSSLGFYKMRSLEGCLGAYAIPKSMIGVLDKKDCFLALMSQIAIQYRMLKDKEFNQLGSMFKKANEKQFLFDADLFQDDQIDLKNNTVKSLSVLSSKVHFYSKDAKTVESDYYVYLVVLPNAVGGGTYLCVYSGDEGAFYSEPIESFKGSNGNLTEEQIMFFERAVNQPKQFHSLLGK